MVSIKQRALVALVLFARREKARALRAKHALAQQVTRAYARKKIRKSWYVRIRV